MFYVAKTPEGLGIAGVMPGLMHGINSPTLWCGLSLGILGIALFLAGWGIENFFTHRQQRAR